MKCQCCKEQQSEWSWQPFGPDQSIDTFCLPGNHYRGFPVIKVCFSCRNAVQTGDFPVSFTYKGFRYVAEKHEVREVKPSFWDGGESCFEHARGSATIINRDTPDGVDLVAMVADPALVPAFVALPALLDACEKIALAFQADCEELSREQSLALASVRNVLDELKAKK